MVDVVLSSRFNQNAPNPQVTTPATTKKRIDKRFRSIDGWEAITDVFKEHQITSGNKRRPRGVIYLMVFIIAVTSATATVLFMQTLGLMFKALHSSIYSAVNGDTGIKGALTYLGIEVTFRTFAMACALFLGSARFTKCSGQSPYAILYAHLNGLCVPYFNRWIAIPTKLLSCFFGIAAGIPIGYLASFGELGAIFSTCVITTPFGPLKGLAKWFQKPNDIRLMTTIGIATGLACGFISSVGGLLLILELLAVKFSVKYAEYVFSACIISGVLIDMFTSYFDSFALLSDRSAMGFAQMRSIPRIFTSLDYGMLPIAILIAVVATCFQMLMTKAVLRTVKTRWCQKWWVVLLMTVLFTLVNGSLVFAFGGHNCDQNSVYNDGRKFQSNVFQIGHALDLFCDGNHSLRSDGTDDLINTYASFRLNTPDSVFEFLIRPATGNALSLPAVAAYFAVYYLGTLYFFGVSETYAGDILLPSLVTGALTGRMVHDVLHMAFGFSGTYFDPGLCALLGAASYLAALTRLTYSLAFIMINMSGDPQQLLMIMTCISVANVLARKFQRAGYFIRVLYARGVPVLENPEYMHMKRFHTVTLHNYQCKCDMLPESATVEQTLNLLKNSKHHAFPVVTNKGQLLGMVARTDLEVLLLRLTDLSVENMTSQSPIVSHIIRSNEDDEDEEDRTLPPKGRRPVNPLGTRSKEPAMPQVNLHRRRSTYTSLARRVESISDFNMKSPAASQAKPLLAGNNSTALNNSSRGSSNIHTVQPRIMSYRPTVSDRFMTNIPDIDLEARASAVRNANITYGVENPNQQQNANASPLMVRTGRDGIVGYGTADDQDESNAVLDTQQPDVDDEDEFVKMKRLADYVQKKRIEKDNERGSMSKDYEFANLVSAIEQLPQAIRGGRLGVLRYTDRSTFVVRHAMTVPHMYEMFTRLGLRHVVIVDYAARPVGTLTRSDLIYEALKKTKRAVLNFHRSQRLTSKIDTGMPMFTASRIFTTGTGSKIWTAGSTKIGSMGSWANNSIARGESPTPGEEGGSKDPFISHTRISRMLLQPEGSTTNGTSNLRAHFLVEHEATGDSMWRNNIGRMGGDDDGGAAAAAPSASANPNKKVKSVMFADMKMSVSSMPDEQEDDDGNDNDKDDEDSVILFQSQRYVPPPADHRVTSSSSNNSSSLPSTKQSTQQYFESPTGGQQAGEPSQFTSTSRASASTSQRSSIAGANPVLNSSVNTFGSMGSAGDAGYGRGGLHRRVSDHFEEQFQEEMNASQQQTSVVDVPEHRPKPSPPSDEEESE